MVDNTPAKSPVAKAALVTQTALAGVLALARRFAQLACRRAAGAVVRSG